MKVYEARVERENGDEDTVYLCTGCLPAVDTFLTVLSTRRAKTSRCDRCGVSDKP
jgi:hypothetical protein